jgi:hypothetical protein
MTVPGCSNPLLMYGDAGAFQVSRSLRFNAADSAYLNRTPASAGNRKTWTWSGWVKRSGLSTQEIFAGGAGGGDTTQFEIGFASAGQFFCWGAVTEFITTAQVFRDVGAWYHIFVALDTTQATASNRLKVYINGVEVTAFSGDSRSSLTLNGDFGINQAAIHTIGRRASAASWYLDGYLANIHFIDGQALTPASFAETDATTGQWIPKAYTGSYGTNGFYLRFNDNSTTAALGTDSSGNGNTWTTNNLSVTAAAGNDSLIDSPTNYGTDTGVGGEVRGNYATLNPLNNPGGSTLSNGNLDCVTSSSLNGRVVSTIAVSSGKWYWEMLATNIATDLMVGISAASETTATTIPTSATTYLYDSYYGDKWNNGSHSAYGATYTTNDVIGVALNLDAGTLVFYKNGTSQGTAYSSLSGTFVAAFADGGTGTSAFTANFGQRAFAYTAPSGFKALCTQNLPAPLVTKPSTVFDVVTYTGSSGSQTISGLQFSSDLLWIKCRSTAGNYHTVADTVRGIGSNGAYYRLFTNTTEAEIDDGYDVTAITSTGFTLPAGSSYANAVSRTYVAWAWDAGTSTVSNTQGSITGGAQVRANPTAGFSVVTYTGNGASGDTVGHGLNVAPQLLIVKRRSSAGSTANWAVWHGSLTAGQNLFLNATDSASAYSPSRFTSTLPTSTVFSIGGGDETNYSGGTFVAYCFSPVVGYSSFGSYVGNGSSDGPMVWTGFRPRWIMYKVYSGDTGHWFIHDTARSPYNESNYHLWANLSNAEATSIFYPIDILSNGFKIRSSNVNINGSGYGFIYMAFAEAPFNYSRAR